jgi:hypothetical protein
VKNIGCDGNVTFGGNALGNVLDVTVDAERFLYNDNARVLPALFRLRDVRIHLPV